MPVKTCGSCKEKFKSKDLRSLVRSLIHSHQAAHKGQKIIGVVASFRNLETGKPAAICGPCQRLILSGMYNGGNWK